MPRALRLTVLLFVIVLLIPSGCSDETTNEPMPPSDDVTFDPDVDPPSASGYIYRTGSGRSNQGDPAFFVVSEPASAPEGTTPAANLLLEVTDPRGAVVTTESTDDDGEFRFDDLPDGPLSLLVRDNVAPDLVVPFRGVRGQTLDLGFEPTVSREDAIDAIQSTHGPDALVLGSLSPLPEGTVVYSAEYARAGVSPPASEVMRIREPAWFFFVDSEWDARFGHPVTYVTVGANSGDLTTLEGPQYAPAIHHRTTWSEETEYILYDGIDLDDFDPANIPPGASFTPTAEVVQLPAGPGFRGAGQLDSHENDGATRTQSEVESFLSEVFAEGSNSDTFVLILQGDGASAFRVDVRNMQAWMRVKDVPSSQVAVVDQSSRPVESAASSLYKTKFEEFNATIKRRLEDEGRQSTLVVYITSHGTESLSGIVIEGVNGRLDIWTPRDLCLPESRACRLRVFIDACYADQFGASLAALLPDHDYRIASSSRADQTSKMVAMWAHLRYGTRPGSFFTNAIFDQGGLAGNDFTGLYPMSDGAMMTNHPVVQRQNPQLRSKTQTPTWCVPVVGVCCLTDGSCVAVTRQEDCDGEYLAGVSSCDPNPCPQPGACCVGEDCLLLALSECESVSGLYLGNGTACSPNPCPGACCLLDGSCVSVSITECSNQDGVFRGVGRTCDPNPCPQSGACCETTGRCVIVVGGGDCVGTYQGDGTTCDPNPCPQPGACCSPNGTCAVVLESECNAEFLGAGTECDPNPCPQPGACCDAAGDCAVRSMTQCAEDEGNYQGNGTACDPNPCPEPPEGACCWGDNNERCAVRSEARCNRELGGAYLGDGTTCFSDPCTDPLAGACCLGEGRCEFLREASCIGEFQGVGVACSPELCPQPAQGACCFESGNCRMLLATECQNSEGTYQGDGTICDPNPCGVPDTGACCIGETCTIVGSFDECEGGIYLGIGTVCAPTSCLEGACCSGEDCIVILGDLCRDGEFEAGVPCEPNPCIDRRACCLPTGSCELRTQQDCASAEGWFYADQTVCSPSTCQPLGACCVEIVCRLVPGEEFCTGEYWGDGTPCNPLGGCPVGACCREDGCVIQFGPGLCEDGDFLLFEEECAPSPCTGACCTITGCVVAVQMDCEEEVNGDFQGVGTDCATEDCPVFGACCVGTECTLVEEEDCAGEYKGDGVVCAPATCSPVLEVEEAFIGVIHGSGASDLCLRLVFSGSFAGAIAEIAFTGASNPGTEIGEIGSDGVLSLSHQIFLFGQYEWEVEQVSRRETDFEVTGITSGEILVGAPDVPCPR